MEKFRDLARPSKEEQKIAIESYDALEAVLSQLQSESPEIEIEETKEKIRVPLKALQLLAKVLKAMSTGKPFSLVPIATEVTTQKAAEIIGCSRPFWLSFLMKGKSIILRLGNTEESD